MEKLFLSDLFVILAILQYVSVTNIVITVLISLAMFQFVCIVALHTKTLLFATFPKCEMIFDFSRVSLQVSKHFMVLRKFKATRCARSDLELASVVPEKTYNYEEFQEPLVAIGQH